LTSVTIQGTGVEIDGRAFQGCRELSDLKFADGDKVIFPLVIPSNDRRNEPFIYGSNAFNGCKKLPLAMRSKLNEMGFTDM
jgi:hypothetical protein